MIRGVVSGVIPEGLKLPGSRKMGVLIGVSRRTVILAYEELEAQGWIVIHPNQGTFVSSKIPVVDKKPIKAGFQEQPTTEKVGFARSDKLDFLDYYTPPKLEGIRYVFDTGYPDVRLAPSRDLSQSFNRALRSKRHSKILNYYSDFLGHPHLREALAIYLSETRGIKTALPQLMITRGSLMAFTAIFQVLLEKGDKVVVGDVSFMVANNIVRIAGGEVVTVPVDDDGIDVNALEKLCQKEVIRAVFVMPHHHHPTTVSLSAGRRMKLLWLAAEYRFAIIEDDYDYDFHYASSPILPMASADRNGTVIYVGSLSKIVAPGLRLGFVVAPADFIRDLARVSRFMDCHGNTALEKAVASLFQEGIIRRHLKKSLKVYRERRNLFCQLMQDNLGERVRFRIPEGGLAAWAQFDEQLPLPELRDRAAAQGLLISRSVFTERENRPINAIRMGFASLNEQELEAAVELLAEIVK